MGFGTKLARADLTNLIVGLVGVFTGFMLAVAWDQYKVTRDQNIELTRAIRSLRAEAETNAIILQRDLEHLKADISAADEQKEVILPLDPLILSALETVYLKGSLEIKSVDISVQLHQLYSVMRVTNQRIAALDLYRATNQAMDNFARRRKIMDQDILSQLMDIKSKQEQLMKRIGSN